jgi:addiction module HigA family antidote
MIKTYPLIQIAQNTQTIQKEYYDEVLRIGGATGGKIKVSTMQTKLSEIINGKRAMSADFAVLLGQVLDTSPRMWMNLQVNLDIWEAERDVA